MAGLELNTLAVALIRPLTPSSATYTGKNHFPLKRTAMAHPTLDVPLEPNELYDLLEIIHNTLTIPPNSYLPDYNIYLGLMLSFAQLVLDRVNASPPNSETHRVFKHALQTQLNELYNEMNRIAAFNLLHPLRRNPYEQATSFFADKILLLQWLATTATVEDLRYAATTRAQVY